MMTQDLANLSPAPPPLKPYDPEASAAGVVQDGETPQPLTLGTFVTTWRDTYHLTYFANNDRLEKLLGEELLEEIATACAVGHRVKTTLDPRPIPSPPAPAAPAPSKWRHRLLRKNAPPAPPKTTQEPTQREKYILSVLKEEERLIERDHNLLSGHASPLDNGPIFDLCAFATQKEQDFHTLKTQEVARELIAQWVKIVKVEEKVQTLIPVRRAVHMKEVRKAKQEVLERTTVVEDWVKSRDFLRELTDEDSVYLTERELSTLRRGSVMRVLKTLQLETAQARWTHERNTAKLKKLSEDLKK